MKTLFWIVVGVLFIDYMLILGGSRNAKDELNIKPNEEK